MLFNSLAASSLLIGTVFAAAEPAPFQLGSMSLNQAFGLNKRQAGYQPTETYCGPGETCAESCGPTYETCASSDGDLHCYDPTVQQICCPDLTGNSCDAGYYCTSDSSGNTWCCPNGMDLVACAAVYSLTGTLASETPTATPSAASSSVSAPTTTAPSTIASTTAPTSKASIVPVTRPSVGTVTMPSTTTSGTAQFTGAANANGAYGGLPALAIGIAGVVAVL